MDIPLELSFHNMEPSDALKAAVREHVNKLEQFHDHIIGCRVVVEQRLALEAEPEQDPAELQGAGLRESIR